MDELTQLQEVLTNELTPTLEYGNYTDIDINAILLQIKDIAPNSYTGIMQWLLPYKTRFRHLSTNAKRFVANVCCFFKKYDRPFDLIMFEYFINRFVTRNDMFDAKTDANY